MCVCVCVLERSVCWARCLSTARWRHGLGASGRGALVWHRRGADGGDAETEQSYPLFRYRLVRRPPFPIWNFRRRPEKLFFPSTDEDDDDDEDEDFEDEDEWDD